MGGELACWSRGYNVRGELNWSLRYRNLPWRIGEHDRMRSSLFSFFDSIKLFRLCGACGDFVICTIIPLPCWIESEVSKLMVEEEWKSLVIWYRDFGSLIRSCFFEYIEREYWDEFEYRHGWIELFKLNCALSENELILLNAYTWESTRKVKIIAIRYKRIIDYETFYRSVRNLVEKPWGKP